LPWFAPWPPFAEASLSGDAAHDAHRGRLKAAVFKDDDRPGGMSLTAWPYASTDLLSARVAACKARACRRAQQPPA
jgi:hypothetical protein